MRIDENWAISPERIRSFFREQADVHETEDGFRFGSCAVSLEERTGQALGKWEIPRTQIIFEGEDADVRSLHRRFFLRFLSAGG